MLEHRRREWILIGLIVWLVVSTGTFIVLMLPFVVPQDQLARFIPECDWQTRFQQPCAFCGMTTAFYAISRGDFTEAYHLNPLSLYIYSGLLLNTVCAVIALKRAISFISSLGATLRSDNLLS